MGGHCWQSSRYSTLCSPLCAFVLDPSHQIVRDYLYIRPAFLETGVVRRGMGEFLRAMWGRPYTQYTFAHDKLGGHKAPSALVDFYARADPVSHCPGHAQIRGGTPTAGQTRLSDDHRCHGVPNTRLDLA